MPLKIRKYISASSRGGNRKPLKKVVKKLRAYKKQK